MRLSPKAFAITAAALWGGCGMLLPALLNLILPAYGEHYLLTMSSVYPGYHATRTLADVLAGTGYGLVDGAIAGFLFAWLYNLIAGKVAPST